MLKEPCSFLVVLHKWVCTETVRIQLPDEEMCLFRFRNCQFPTRQFVIIYIRKMISFFSKLGIVYKFGKIIWRMII